MRSLGNKYRIERESKLVLIDKGRISLLMTEWRRMNLLRSYKGRGSRGGRKTRSMWCDGARIGKCFKECIMNCVQYYNVK